jgi:hypothetical protein
VNRDHAERRYKADSPGLAQAFYDSDRRTAGLGALKDWKPSGAPIQRRKWLDRMTLGSDVVTGPLVTRVSASMRQLRTQEGRDHAAWQLRRARKELRNVIEGSKP